MEANKCETCLKNTTSIQCDSCHCLSCKKCSHFINENNFEFQSLLPEELRGKTFCTNCYNNEFEEKFLKYEDILMRAQEVTVYEKKLSSKTRQIPRSEKAIRVVDCPGRKEAILQLAFIAASRDFNTLVDVDLVYKKIANGSYKAKIWTAVGVPAYVEPRRSR